MRSIEIFTDGAARPSNPGHGAYAFVITEKDTVLYEDCKYYGESTANVMELTAAIEALEWCIENCKEDLIWLYTDSQYLQQGITSWIDKWKERNWKTGSRDPVANQELWKKLDELRSKLRVNFQWIRSHSGIPNNEKVDQMCTDLLEAKILELKEENDDKNKDQ